MKKLVSLMALFVLSLLSLGLALNQTNVALDSVRINGDTVANGEVLSVEEGQVMKIRLGLTSVDGAEDVEVEAKIGGYEYSDYESLSDATHLFDITAGTTKYVSLEVELPRLLEKDNYVLRLRVLDKNTAAINWEIPLRIEPVRHGVDIKDVSFSPGSTIKAGRSLLASVLVQNYGDRDEEEVKVTVEIPDLGVRASEYVEDMETDNHNVDYEAVQEMFLPIPADAEEGDYEVTVNAKYDDLRESVTQTFTIHVLADERFQAAEEKLVLAVGPETQNVVAGQTASYAVALTNAGTASKAYVLETVAGNWATLSLSDSLIVLEPGKNKVVYVELTPLADATLGTHVASLNVKSGEEVLETVTFEANVVQGTVAAQPSFNLRNGLEIALVILVVVLLIVGLIIGFSRMRKDEEGEGKNYY